jgi:hypothetical protein
MLRLDAAGTLQGIVASSLKFSILTGTALCFNCSANIITKTA